MTENKPRSRGRPAKPSGKKLGSIIQLRVTPDEKAALQAIAEAQSKHVSEYLREILLADINKSR